MNAKRTLRDRQKRELAPSAPPDQRSLAQSDVYSVVCPACGAAIGAACDTPGFRENVVIHASRLEAHRRWLWERHGDPVPVRS